MPGRVGLQIHGETGRILGVPEGTQAHQAGVKVGWFLRRIDGETYSAQLFDEFFRSEMPYKVDFEAPLASCLEEADLGSTGLTAKVLARLEAEIVPPANFFRELSIRDNAGLLADEA